LDRRVQDDVETKFATSKEKSGNFFKEGVNPPTTARIDGLLTIS